MINKTETEKTNMGRFLCLILRHKPEVVGVTLDEHGWVNVYDLLDAINASGRQLYFADLCEIVETDEKERYEFDVEGDRIRANQGHSIDVDVELKCEQPPEFLYHGTCESFLDIIFNYGGLKACKRLYVHLSTDLETAKAVGKRRGFPRVFIIKSGDMFHDGYPFFLSKNGVWLTKEVPGKYMTLLKED